METWQINLSLIPSIAVILTSANRTVLGLTDEINVRILANPEAYSKVLPLKITQLKRLSVAVFLMYLSLVCLILNALLVGVNVITPKNDKVLIFLAVIIFFVAVFYMLLFSWNAYFIRQKQFKVFLEKLSEN